MLVHEIEPGVFVPFPSGRPVYRTSTVETVIVRREDGSETQQDRECDPYPVEIRPARVILTWTTEERAAVGVFEAAPYSPTPGKVPTGERRFVRNRAGAVVETYDEEDAPPPPPEPTRADKLARLLGDYGLSKDDLQAELGVAVADAEPVEEQAK